MKVSSRYKETSLRVKRVIIRMGIWSAPVILLYTLMVYLGVAPAGHILAAHSPWLIAITFLTVIVGQIGCFLYSRDERFFGSYVLTCHVIVALYMIFVSGLVSPVLLYWAPLFILALLYFGLKAGIASGGLLVATALYLSLTGSDPNEKILLDLFWAMGTLMVGSLIVMALRGIDLDQREIVSTRATAERQQDRTLTLINNLADAIISTDVNGKILVYNAALLNLLDTNADLAGVNISELLTLKDTNNHPIDILDMLAGSSAVKIHDDLVAVIDGEPVRLEVTSSAIHGGYGGESEQAMQASGYIVILRDITKSKSLEEERDEFISVVSHELRTPITIAEGTISNASLMLERGATTPEKLSDSISLAHDQIVFLARMVNDLSTLSRAERGVAADREDIDVAEMIHDLYNEYQPQAAEKGLGFDLHMPGKPGRVNVSRLYFKELLQNFVTNAIKYTKEGKVTVTVQAEHDGTITFAVKDTGIGISKSDQKRIFEKFYRAEDYRTRETSGTGLGLYVAHKLASKLGTTIEMKSRLNHGSTFSITLPKYHPPKTGE